MSLYRYFMVTLAILVMIALAGFLFGQGMKIGQHLKLEQKILKDNYGPIKLEQKILKDDYRSLNHRLNNLEQNYDRVIRLYTLGREEEKGE